MSWEPIATAPKDGTPVDLWIPAGATGNESGTSSRATDCQFIAGEWQLNGEWSLPWLQEATHWMRLPDPPAPIPAPARPRGGSGGER